MSKLLRVLIFHLYFWVIDLIKFDVLCASKLLRAQIFYLDCRFNKIYLRFVDIKASLCRFLGELSMCQWSPVSVTKPERVSHRARHRKCAFIFAYLHQLVIRVP